MIFIHGYAVITYLFICADNHVKFAGTVLLSLDVELRFRPVRLGILGFGAVFVELCDVCVI
jgi:hypothetical protein